MKSKTPVDHISIGALLFFFLANSEIMFTLEIEWMMLIGFVSKYYFCFANEK